MTKTARPPGIGRLEAFSDAVLAIVLTLLVLDLLPRAVQSPGQLLASWPSYVAFLAAFLTVGVVWLNHNQALSRLRSANPAVLAINLGILLGATLMPWPTALIAVALEEGDRPAQVAAIVIFAIVTIVISAPWLALDLYLIRHPQLLTSASDVTWMRAHARGSVATILGAGASVALAFVSPLASLVLYLVVSAVFIAVGLRERVAGSPDHENG